MVDLGFSLYPERYDVTKSKAYVIAMEPSACL